MPPRNPWKLRLWPLGDHDAIVAAAAERRQTFEAIDTPLVVLDANDHLAGLNAAAQRLLGLEFKDHLGRTLESIAPWEPWNGVTAAAREARARAGSSGPISRSSLLVWTPRPGMRRGWATWRSIRGVLNLRGSVVPWWTSRSSSELTAAPYSKSNHTEKKWLSRAGWLSRSRLSS